MSSVTGATGRAPFPITYPDLPITERRDELLEVIDAHQVVVVAGETGSGKSTQLPKFCLELGRGQGGARIGHTQPRRIAARSIAERLADELGSEVGGTVGYAVRFTDEVGSDTLVKVMTDGILLNEIQRDRDLRSYDTIIVDEAHERSLNIDFLLGHLRRLIDRRDDLKVIITSATIDTERFAEHFGRDGEPAPVIEVSGRTYPVEIRHRPLDTDAWGEQETVLGQPEAVCAAVQELFTEGDGDILAFFAGERDIRDAQEALEELSLPGTEVVPLYARLSAAEQHRVFSRHRGRRVVLSTNVAETSLTVPGIRYVIDTGTARISRFNRRTKVQRLPIEPISQASANQRAGRCGRLGPGVAIRLYDQDDYDNRPEFTEPEIQRTNLAAVILRMKAARLGDIDDFPFVDAPDTRSVKDGLDLLHELGATETDGSLTDIGRRIDRLPVDPRIARMVLAGAEHHCLEEVLIIAAGLSVRDPRERPKGQEQAAAESHRRFRVDGSDLLGWPALWEYIREQRAAGSSSRFRRQCRKEFLNYPRIREWQEVESQLRRAAKQVGLRTSDQPGRPEDVHRAVLTGLLSQIGLRDRETKEYKGTRGTRFAISPASALFKTGPEWVVAADLVETTRTWAHSAARVDRDWIVDAAEHLIRFAYGDPWWDTERGSASVLERAVLLGLVLYDDQPVQLSRIDPDDARTMFIRHALVEGQWHAGHKFVERNHARIREVLELESRNRRADLLVGDEDLVDWFSERLPEHITSVAAFDAWWRRRRKKHPHLLDLRVDDLVEDDVTDDLDEEQFPGRWLVGDVGLRIDYVFEPGDPDDGVTVNVPPEFIDLLDPAAFTWNVPGRRAEVVERLVRGLPKPLRRQLVPVPDTVRSLLAELDPMSGLTLADAVRGAVAARIGEAVPVDAVRQTSLPNHLRVRFRLAGEGADVTSFDLDDLRISVEARRVSEVASAKHDVEATGATTWQFGDLPTSVELGGRTTAYPALVDEGSTVGVTLVATPADQAGRSWDGLRRLLRLQLTGLARAMRPLMNDELKLGLAVSPYPDTSAWFDDAVSCAIDVLIARHGLVWTSHEWDELLADARDHVIDVLSDVIRSSTRILAASRRVRSAVLELRGERLVPSATDMAEQRARLVRDAMLADVGAERLADVERYLRALEVRVERVADNVRQDQAGLVVCRRLEAEWAELVTLTGMTVAAEDIGWMLQELRVATFAQAVGAKGPISEKRIRTALNAARHAP